MKITFRPIEEIVILEEIRHESPQELFGVLIAGIPPGSIVVAIWAEGIVLRHDVLSLDTPPAAQERMKGIIYWRSLRYAEMPEYKESESIEGRTIKIVKTRSSALIEVARKLKLRLKGGKPWKQPLV